MKDQQNLSTADLDQVRNILFGRQMKESDKRAERFELALKKEVENLRAEFNKRFDAVEKSIKLQGERQDKDQLEGAAEREALNEALGKQIDVLKKAGDERFTRLSEASTRSARELKQRIAQEIKATKEAFTARMDELGEELETETGDLREVTVAKDDLSAFLADIALKLVNKKQIRRS